MNRDGYLPEKGIPANIGNGISENITTNIRDLPIMVDDVDIVEVFLSSLPKDGTNRNDECKQQRQCERQRDGKCVREWHA